MISSLFNAASHGLSRSVGSQAASDSDLESVQVTLRRHAGGRRLVHRKRLGPGSAPAHVLGSRGRYQTSASRGWQRYSLSPPGRAGAMQACLRVSYQTLASVTAAPLPAPLARRQQLQPLQWSPRMHAGPQRRSLRPARRAPTRGRGRPPRAALNERGRGARWQREEGCPPSGRTLITDARYSVRRSARRAVATAASAASVAAAAEAS